MILLGYIFGINNEQQLVNEVEVNVAYHGFLRMTVTDIDRLVHHYDVYKIEGKSTEKTSDESKLKYRPS